jgi:putative metallohydrolase (TIGR04338 family)
MTRPRDSQRSKLYAAENAVFNYGQNPRAGRRFTTLDEIDAYLLKVTGSAWFKRRWPVVGANGHWGSKTWRLKDGRGSRTPKGGMMSMSFPRGSRYEAIILHELAHHICERYNGYERTAWHGWQYCAILLELVTHELGEETGDALRLEFKRRNVRFRKPRRNNAKAPLTEEEKQVLRDRLAAYRATQQAAKSDA